MNDQHTFEDDGRGDCALCGEGITARIHDPQLDDERGILHRLATALGWTGEHKPYHDIESAAAYFKELREQWAGEAVGPCAGCREVLAAVRLWRETWPNWRSCDQEEVQHCHARHGLLDALKLPCTCGGREDGDDA